jgi:hypothetical protein
LFTEVDVGKAGKIDAGELEKALRRVMPPEGPFGPEVRAEARP